MTVLPPWLVALQSLVLAACWAYVGRRLLARWMDDPAIKQMRQANDGWYVQTTRHKLLQIGAHMVYAGALSVPLIAALSAALPQQYECPNKQSQSAKNAKQSCERGLPRVSANNQPGRKTRAELVVDPLANRHQASTHEKQNERLPQRRVIAERHDAYQTREGEVGERPVPLVGGEALEVVHGGRAYRLTRLRAKR